MDNRLLIEIYREPTGELVAKFKHLQGDTEIDEEFYVKTEHAVSPDRPEDEAEDSARQTDVERFFDEALIAGKDRLFPEYAPGTP